MTLESNLTAAFQAVGGDVGRLNVAARTPVSAYGAVGDGTTNCTAAFNAALASGKRITVPPGTWSIAALTVPTSAFLDVELQRGATVKLRDGVNTPMIPVPPSTRIHIHGSGTIDGNAAGQTGPNAGTEAHGIYFSPGGMEYSRIEGITIRDTKSVGILSAGTGNGTVDGVTFLDTGGVAVNVQASVTGPDMRGWTIVNTVTDKTAMGAACTSGALKIDGQPSAEVKVTGAVIANNRTYLPVGATSDKIIGIELYGGGGDSSTVVGNAMSGGYMGISMDASAKFAVTGNAVFQAAVYSLELAAVRDCTVQGNTVVGGQYGIITQNPNGTKNVTITGNTLTDQTVSAIAVTDGATVVNICGNNISSVNGSAGVEVAEGTSKVSVSGNTIDGKNAMWSGVFAQNASQVTISGNQFVNIGDGVTIVASGSGKTADHYGITGNTFWGASNAINAFATNSGSLGANVQKTGNVAPSGLVT